MVIFCEHRKYQVIGFDLIKSSEGSRWRVDLGIRRMWPFSWIDHRPWEEFARRAYPVKTFIGNGDTWHELRGEDKQYNVIGFTEVLNSIVAREALKSISELHGADELPSLKLNKDV